LEIAGDRLLRQPSMNFTLGGAALQEDRGGAFGLHLPNPAQIGRGVLYT
jgi:hypothetical protein